MEQGFHDVTKSQYGLISHNPVSHEQHAIESGFIVHIKGKIKTLTDFEISHRKRQSLWKN